MLLNILCAIKTGHTQRYLVNAEFSSDLVDLKSKASGLSAYAAPCKCRSSLNTPSWREFGRCAIHGALVTSPARCSLIIGMFC